MDYNARDFGMTSGARARTATAPATTLSAFAPSTTSYSSAVEDDASGWNDVKEALQAAERQSSVATELPLPSFRAGGPSLARTMTNNSISSTTTPTTSSSRSLMPAEAGSSSTLMDSTGLASDAGIGETMSVPAYLTSPFPAAVSLPPPPLKPFDPWSASGSSALSSASTSTAFKDRAADEQRVASQPFPRLGPEPPDHAYRAPPSVVPPRRPNHVAPGPPLPVFRHQSFPPRQGNESYSSYDESTYRPNRQSQNRQPSLPPPSASSIVGQGSPNPQLGPRFQPHGIQAYKTYPDHTHLPRLSVQTQTNRRRVFSEGADGHSPTIPSGYGSEFGPGMSPIASSLPFPAAHSPIEGWRAAFPSQLPPGGATGATPTAMRSGPATMSQRPADQRAPPSSPLIGSSTDSASLKPPAGLKLRSGLPERTSYAMWVGNIPTDSSEQELWSFFLSRQPLPTAPGGLGLQSIHLIARSQCAFLNLDSEDHLFHMIAQAHGVTLRPNDARCKPLVCRVRRTEDDAKSGVGAQRGGGLHKAWVKMNGTGGVDPVMDRDDAVNGLKEQVEAMKDELKKDDERKRVQVGNELESERESIESTSSGSTDSGFFHQHFPRRYFILKSHNQFDLEQSVKHGYWSTQAHNEPVLDQAFRTASEGVYIVFSANKSGNWFGVAKMAGPIYPAPKEDGYEKVDPLSSAIPGHHAASSNANSAVTSLSSPVPRSSLEQRQQQLGTETSSAIRRPFRVQWLTSQSVPFVRTRHLSNSFNSNREVKICRDGTEVEPIAGEQLVQEVMRRAPSSSISPAYSAPGSTTLPTAPVF
ncbi:hypothetical protein ACM66B_003246 [Microbotryomycetes sp. NB124-2]